MHNRALVISVLGDKGVGKSSLIASFSDKEFTTDYHSTVGIDICIRTIQLDNLQRKFQIFDLGGGRRFESVWLNQIKTSRIAVITFDLSSRSSWESIPSYIQMAKNESQDLIFMLVGTKADLCESRVITQDEINLFMNENAPYIECYWETSAKEHRHTSEVFEMCARLALSKETVNTKTRNDEYQDEESNLRKTIHGMLLEYDKYIRDNVFLNSAQPDYQFGFLLMAGSRGLNRAATYLLIISLMQDVLNPSVALETLFVDVEAKRCVIGLINRPTTRAVL
jgi:small GTP-binding protein